MLGHVLQGPPMFTHAFKAKADTRKKREPPTHPQQKEQTTQPSNASKEERKDTTRRNATETKRQTSKTEHQQDAGPRVDRKANHSSPNSRIKNQGLASKDQPRKKNNKQQTKGPATHVSYQSTRHKHQTTQRKTRARPRREKGELGDPPKARKKSQPPPSCRLAILPIHEGVGRDGLSARGG